MRYYFLDLPLWSMGMRSNPLKKRLVRSLQAETSQFLSGLDLMKRHTALPRINCSPEDLAEKAIWVKIIRESDAYTSLRMTRKRLDCYFRIEGLGHLQQFLKTGRPVFLLTGHIGSFFIPAIAFGHMGLSVFPIARTVEPSSVLPFERRLYERINYLLSGLRLPSSHYIFTSYPGTIDRKIIRLCNSEGIFWAALDLPGAYYSYKRMPVKILGFTSSLPSGLIQLGMKYNAVFLTAWNMVEPDPDAGFIRHLKIDEPFPEGLNVTQALQLYADRLSSVITAEPWQWAGIPIMHEFIEESRPGAGQVVPRPEKN
ncbi:MAG: hypothetical protein HZA17_08340 [Nitrospirae bacterium]|nr:hypothetical protein [Nitrospirota bacterium]